MYPQMQGRRLRLIHLGRILPNGVRLASWLDTLSLVEEEPHAEMMHLRRRPAEHDMYTLEPGVDIDNALHDKWHGKQRSLDPDLDADGPLHTTVWRQPTVYLQCSIGGLLEEEPEHSEGQHMPEPAHEPRGFDRLRQTAGMSALDIQLMREQFHQRSGLQAARSGDLLRRREEQEMAYQLEEQWIDSMAQTPMVQTRTSVPMSVLKGLMIGFFFPILPFLFAYDPKPIRWPRIEPTLPDLPTAMGRPEERQRLESALSDAMARMQTREAASGPQMEAQREETRRAITSVLDFLVASRQAQDRAQSQTSSTSARETQRSGDHDDDDDDDEEDDEEEEAGTETSPSLRRRFRWQPPSPDRYVIFSPYTLAAILLGFLIKYVFDVCSPGTVLYLQPYDYFGKFYIVGDHDTDALGVNVRDEGVGDVGLIVWPSSSSCSRSSSSRSSSANANALYRSCACTCEAGALS